MQRRNRGVGLAATLGLTGLIVLVAFVTVGASFAQLGLANHNDRLSEAESAADSAAQLAIAKLLENPDYGAAGDNTPRSLEIQLPQGRARLTFDATQAQSWGIPLSRNNLSLQESASGFERTIPPQSAQLLAEGQSGGVRRRVEVVVNMPPFKWAVAATGPVHSSGGLRVLGVKDFAALANGLENVPPDQLVPGHILSNSQSLQALQLDSNPTAPSLITGDAQSMGGIALGPATLVEGLVKQNSEPGDLPEVEVEHYDPAGVDGLQILPAGSFNPSSPLSGVMRSSGDLTINGNGLQFDRGYLYVDGDLEIFGGLSGRGAIFSTGNVTIHGQSAFDADSLQAILARGDVTLEGSGPENSSFQGLVMGAGNLNASRVSLVGSFIGASRSAQGSHVDLDQVRLISNPQAISFDLPEIFTVLPAPYAGQAPLSGYPVSAQILPDPTLSSQLFYDPLQDALDPNLVTLASLKPIWRFNGHTQSRRIRAFLDGQSIGAIQISQVPQQLAENFRTGVNQANKIYRVARSRGLPAGHFSLDPNQFIQSRDKMRRLIWRVIP